MIKNHLFVSCLLLVFSMLSWADSSQTIPKEILDRPEFYSKMDVIENLELIETATESDLKTAATVADLPEVSPPDEINTGGSDE